VCTGTSFGLRRTGYAGNWSLQRYIRLYENCIYVDGNLEITYLENGLYDLSFLSTIQEVKFKRPLYNVCFAVKMRNFAFGYFCRMFLSLYLLPLL